jgi:L-ascorbate metabolism protein UlaG (beta-lactamase superfamily)
MMITRWTAFIVTMRVSWLGHSCFRLEGSQGLSILTDPFGEDIGYGPPDVRADIVLLSHGHSDHNNIQAVKGSPVAIKGPGKHMVQGMEFRGIETYHDEEGGRLRGANTIFCFQLDGLAICHLGDLGHILRDAEVRSIGSVDLLFLPVGGHYTLNGRKAWQVIDQLHPRIAVPMHYQTDILRFRLGRVEEFLRGHEYEGPFDSLEVSREDLKAEGLRVVLLNYVKASREG